MGKRDLPKHEVKKPRKEAKKLVSVVNLGISPTTEVEVIKKGKKPKEFEEE